jgi:hypothetical protein
VIKGEGYLSQKKIAQMPGTGHETVKRIMRHDLKMYKVNFKWVMVAGHWREVGQLRELPHKRKSENDAASDCCLSLAERDVGA